MTEEELKAEVAKRHWFHIMELAPGVVTPGAYKPDTEWLFNTIGVPLDLTGKRALDLGCADGAHSFGMAKMGAAVTAVDLFSPDFRNVEFISQLWDIPVTYRQSSVYTLDEEPFDLILALGVIYHLEHPLLALQNLNKQCTMGGMLLLESHVEHALMLRNKNLASFWPDDQLNNDPSNWWTPTRKCLDEMLRVSGFRVVQRFNTEKHRYLLRAEKIENRPPALHFRDVYNRYYGHDPY